MGGSTVKGGGGVAFVGVSVEPSVVLIVGSTGVIFVGGSVIAVEFTVVLTVGLTTVELIGGEAVVGGSLEISVVGTSGPTGVNGEQ